MRSFILTTADYPMKRFFMILQRFCLQFKRFPKNFAFSEV